MRTKMNTLHRLKAGPGDALPGREFTAYASTWTRTPDPYGDVIAPDAFTDTIAEWQRAGTPCRSSTVTAWTTRTTTSLGEVPHRGHGLLVHGVFDDTPMAEQVYN